MKLLTVWDERNIWYLRLQRRLIIQYKVEKFRPEIQQQIFWVLLRYQTLRDLGAYLSVSKQKIKGKITYLLLSIIYESINDI